LSLCSIDRSTPSEPFSVTPGSAVPVPAPACAGRSNVPYRSFRRPSPPGSRTARTTTCTYSVFSAARLCVFDTSSTDMPAPSMSELLLAAACAENSLLILASLAAACGANGSPSSGSTPAGSASRIAATTPFRFGYRVGRRGMAADRLALPHPGAPADGAPALPELATLLHTVVEPDAQTVGEVSDLARQLTLRHPGQLVGHFAGARADPFTLIDPLALHRPCAADHDRHHVGVAPDTSRDGG